MTDQDAPYRALLTHSAVGLCLAGADGRVIEANPSWCRLAGARPGTLTGTPWAEALHASDRAAIGARLASVRDGEATREAVICRLGDPRATWVRLESARVEDPAGSIALSATATGSIDAGDGDLDAAFARVRDAEHLLQEAIDAMNEGFVYCDADDRVVYFNDKHRELFPSHAHMMRPGVRFEDMLRAQLEGIDLEVARGREEEWIAERIARHRNPKGPIEQRWADGRVIRLTEYKTRSGGIVSIRADITDLKHAQAEITVLNDELEERVVERSRELEQAQAELVRRERLAALGQLIATVGHELRNPLATIRASTHVLREEGVAGEPSERALGRLERAAARSMGIVAELLDFSRPTPLATEETPIDDWLDAVLDELPAPPGVRVVRRLQADGARVRIDRERLRRAMLNLLDNACQAVDGAGTVAVETELREGLVAISVVDDGKGIGEHDLDAIFEPMYTTRRAGVGLGLAIVKRIVDQHGARIEVDSEPGRGARFTILAHMATSTR